MAYSRKHDVEVEFCAFDVLVSDGEEIRKLPLSTRKTQAGPARAVSMASTLHLSSKALDAAGGVGFQHRDRPYRSGRSPHWVKNRNRQHPAFSRLLDQS